MVNSPLIRCTPQVNPSLETELFPVVLIGNTEVALIPRTIVSNPSDFDIIYQNVRGLRTKCSEFTENVCVSNHKINCLIARYINWFQNYLTSRFSVVRTLEKSSSLFACCQECRKAPLWGLYCSICVLVIYTPKFRISALC
jgi:hypothetical protein